MAKNLQFKPGRGYSEADWQEVSNNPPLSTREILTARPFVEALPQFAAAVKGRGAQKAPTKALVSLRITRSTLAAFKALGPGWQREIDKVLSEVAQKRFGDTITHE